MMDVEHLQYDIAMAEHTLALLSKTTDQVLRNALHSACPNYIYNLLVYAGTDINDFRTKVENQVRSLTSKRTTLQHEKLNEPDYAQALQHVIDTMLGKGIIQRNLR